MSHLQKGPDIRDSPPSRWCLTSIQVPKLHLPSSIQVPSETHQGIKIYVSPPLRTFLYCITSIHVQTFLTSIHVASQIQTRSRCTRLTSSHFTYQIPLDQKNCISAQSHSHLTISRSQSVCLSSSHSYINYIQVTRCISHIHSCPLSPPSKSLY